MGRVLLLVYDFLNQNRVIKSSMEEHGWAYYIKLLWKRASPKLEIYYTITPDLYISYKRAITYALVSVRGMRVHVVSNFNTTTFRWVWTKWCLLSIPRKARIVFIIFFALNYFQEGNGSQLGGGGVSRLVRNKYTLEKHLWNE